MSFPIEEPSPTSHSLVRRPSGKLLRNVSLDETIAHTKLLRKFTGASGAIGDDAPDSHVRHDKGDDEVRVGRASRRSYVNEVGLEPAEDDG